MTQLTKEKAIHYLGIDLQRMLYMMRLLQYTMEGMKTNPQCPKFMKREMECVNNSINRAVSVLSDYDKRGHWNLIKKDLASDRLHDLSQIIDLLMDVNELDAVYNAMNQYITEQTQQHEQSSN